MVTSLPPDHILIIGIGNDFRGDDAVGLYVARKLREMDLPQALIMEVTGDLTALTELWKNGPAILVDATRSGAEPGSIYRFDAAVEPLPAQFSPSFSSHALGLGAAIQLARVLKQLPPRLIVYGIEGKSFEAGQELSPEVKSAAAEVVARVLRDLAEGG